MAEYTLLRKLEVLWGIPIFYTDETGKDVRGVGVFSEKQNPLTISGELVNALICQAKEQDVPAICKVLARSIFLCSERTGILSVRSVCVEQLSYVEIHQFTRNIICLLRRNVIRIR